MPATKATVFAADAALAAGCFVLAYKLRSSENLLSTTAWAWSKAFVPYAGVLVFAAASRLAMLLYQRVYNFSGAFSYPRDKDL